MFPVGLPAINALHFFQRASASEADLVRASRTRTYVILGDAVDFGTSYGSSVQRRSALRSKFASCTDGPAGVLRDRSNSIACRGGARGRSSSRSRAAELRESARRQTRGRGEFRADRSGLTRVIFRASPGPPRSRSRGFQIETDRRWQTSLAWEARDAFRGLAKRSGCDTNTARRQTCSTEKFGNVRIRGRGVRISGLRGLGVKPRVPGES